jgi:hypothetical protein
MTGGQLFILILLLGGAAAGALFMMALGIYYWGRAKYEDAVLNGARHRQSR